MKYYHIEDQNFTKIVLCFSQDLLTDPNFHPPVLRGPGGQVGGVELKSSLNAFNRFDAPARQQFSADRWINEFGAQGVGQAEDIFLDNTIKILWP